MNDELTNPLLENASAAAAPALVGGLPLTTLAALLEDRAAALPEQVALIELNVDGSVRAQLTFAELRSRARAIAYRIVGVVGGSDQPRAVVLSVQRNFDFICGLYGIFLAGAAAVPVVPPLGSRHVVRARAILANARFDAVLADEVTAKAFASDLGGAVPPTLSIEAAMSAGGGERALPFPRPDGLAVVQYTSGSTREPRGVMLTHANFLANLAAIQRAMGLRAPSREVMVSWLPPYHDMGLVGMFLNVAYLGATLVALPSTAFLRRPLIWLEAITRYRGTLGGAPNFAYDLCVDAVRSAGVDGLDLRSWRVAFNGAEPIRAETLDRFAACFESAGLPAGAQYPCYGLAEAVVMISGGVPEAAPIVAEVSRQGLRRNRIEAPTAASDAQRLVASGRCVEGHRLVAVEPETRRPLGEGEIGELFFAGPSVARGYLGDDAATNECFGLELSGAGTGFLRTGDLGFVRDGHVFVTGRVKDLIIVHGENHYPHDLELTLGGAAEELRADGCCALAESDADNGAERLVVIAAMRATLPAERLPAIAAAMQDALAREHGLRAAEIVLVKPGSLPRTTSGKLQRSLCRRLLRDGALPVLFRQEYAQPGVLETGVGIGEEDTLARLLRVAASVAGGGVVSFDASTPLEQLGLDSVDRVRLLLAIEEEFGVRVTSSTQPVWTNIGEIAAWLESAATTAPAESPATEARETAVFSPAAIAPETKAAQAKVWRDDILRRFATFQEVTGLSLDSPVQILRIALAMEQFPAVGRERSVALAEAWVRHEQLTGWFFHVPRVQPLLADPRRSVPVIWSQLGDLVATAPSPAIVSLFHTGGWDWLLALFIRAARDAGRRVAVLYDAAVAELSQVLLQRFEVLIGRSAAELRRSGEVTLTDIRDRQLDFHLLRHLDEGRLIVVMPDAVHGSRPRATAVELPLLGRSVRVTGGIYRIAGLRGTPLLNLALEFDDDGPRLTIERHESVGLAEMKREELAGRVETILGGFLGGVGRNLSQWRQWRALVPAPVVAPPPRPGAPLLDRERILILNTDHHVWLMCRSSQRTLAIESTVFRALEQAADEAAFRAAVVREGLPIANLEELVMLLTGRDPHASIA